MPGVETAKQSSPRPYGWRPPAYELLPVVFLPDACRRNAVYGLSRPNKILSQRLTSVNAKDFHKGTFVYTSETFHTTFAYYSPMGGERGTTARMRLAGKICCNCKVPVDLGPWSGGERYCGRCTAAEEQYAKLKR